MIDLFQLPQHKRTLDDFVCDHVCRGPLKNYASSASLGIMRNKEYISLDYPDARNVSTLPEDKWIIAVLCSKVVPESVKNYVSTNFNALPLHYQLVDQQGGI